MHRFLAGAALLTAAACGGGGGSGGAGMSMVVDNQYDGCLVRMIVYAVPEPEPFDDFKAGDAWLPGQQALETPTAVADFNPRVPPGGIGEVGLGLAPGWYRIDLIFVHSFDETSGTDSCEGDPQNGEVITVADGEFPFHLTGPTSCVTTISGPGSIHMECVTPK